MNYIGVQAQDILLNESNEIQLAGDGDFGLTQSNVVYINNNYTMINDCDKRIISDLLQSSIGIWKRTPLAGVNLAKWLNAPMSAINRDIIANRLKDSLLLSAYFTVNKVALNEDLTLNINMLRNKQ